MRWHLMREIEERGAEAVVDDAISEALDGPDAIYLSIDIDVIDPGMAPGTGTPEPGGLLTRELLRAIRRIVGQGAARGHGHRRGLAAVRPRRHHGGRGASLRARGDQRARRAQARRRTTCASRHRTSRYRRSVIASTQRAPVADAERTAQGSAPTPPGRKRHRWRGTTTSTSRTTRRTSTCTWPSPRRPTGPILELMAGSGRVAVPLAAAGHRVAAVDRDPGHAGARGRSVAAASRIARRRRRARTRRGGRHDCSRSRSASIS